MAGRKAYQPVARFVVAPVGVGDAVGQSVAAAEVADHPAAGLYQVHLLHAVGNGREGQHEVERGCRHGVLLAQLYHSGILHGVLLPVGFQVGVLGYPNPLACHVVDVNDHIRAVGQEVHLCHADGALCVVIARHDIVPNGFLCLSRHPDEGKQCGDDDLLVHDFSVYDNERKEPFPCLSVSPPICGFVLHYRAIVLTFAGLIICAPNRRR